MYKNTKNIVSDIPYNDKIHASFTSQRSTLKIPWQILSKFDSFKDNFQFTVFLYAIVNLISDMMPYWA